jgi:hypothetical protein
MSCPLYDSPYILPHIPHQTAGAETELGQRASTPVVYRLHPPYSVLTCMACTAWDLQAQVLQAQPSIPFSNCGSTPTKSQSLAHLSSKPCTHRVALCHDDLCTILGQQCSSRQTTYARTCNSRQPFSQGWMKPAGAVC